MAPHTANVSYYTVFLEMATPVELVPLHIEEITVIEEQVDVTQDDLFDNSSDSDDSIVSDEYRMRNW